MTAKLVWFIPIIALAVALLEMPYGYYVLLRLLVCGVCMYLATSEARVGRTKWAWVLGGFGVLYNPIFTLHLGRDLWSVVNVATIALFAVHMWSHGTAMKQASVNTQPTTPEDQDHIY